MKNFLLDGLEKHTLPWGKGPRGVHSEKCMWWGAWGRFTHAQGITRTGLRHHAGASQSLRVLEGLLAPHCPGKAPTSGRLTSRILLLSVIAFWSDRTILYKHCMKLHPARAEWEEGRGRSHNYMEFIIAVFLKYFLNLLYLHNLLFW